MGQAQYTLNITLAALIAVLWLSTLLVAVLMRSDFGQFSPVLTGILGLLAGGLAHRAVSSHTHSAAAPAPAPDTSPAGEKHDSTLG